MGDGYTPAYVSERRDRLLALMANRGPMGVRDVRAMYEERYGQQDTSYANFYADLRLLAGEGLLIWAPAVAKYQGGTNRASFAAPLDLPPSLDPGELESWLAG